MPIVSKIRKPNIKQIPSKVIYDAYKPMFAELTRIPYVRNSYVQHVSKNRFNIVVDYSKSYGHFVEQGRNPGKMPPDSPIRSWVRENLLSSTISINSLTYLVRRKIGKLGTKGKHLIKKVINKYRSKRVIYRWTTYK